MNKIVDNMFVAMHCREHLNMLHLIHDLVVGSSQSQVHGVHQLAVLEVGWMSAIFLLTLNLTTNSCSFNCK